jgi:hypothetical protein
MCALRPHCGLADAITPVQLSCTSDAAELLRSDDENMGNLRWRYSRERAKALSVEILVLLQWVLNSTWTVFPDTHNALLPL